MIYIIEVWKAQGRAEPDTKKIGSILNKERGRGSVQK